VKRGGGDGIPNRSRTLSLPSGAVTFKERMDIRSLGHVILQKSVISGNALSEILQLLRVVLPSGSLTGGDVVPLVDRSYESLRYLQDRSPRDASSKAVVLTVIVGRSSRILLGPRAPARTLGPKPQ